MIEILIGLSVVFGLIVWIILFNTLQAKLFKYEAQTPSEYFIMPFVMPMIPVVVLGFLYSIGRSFS